MAKVRQSHELKSLSERRFYWDTVIRAKGPTSDDTSPIMDTTDQAASTEKAGLSKLTPTKEPSAIHKFMQEKAIEIIIASVIIPLILWGIYQMYSLNREVGELQSVTKNIASEVDKVENRLTNHYNSLSNDVDKIERRLDEVIDRQLHK